MIQNMNILDSQTTQLDYRMRPAEELEIAENLDGQVCLASSRNTDKKLRTMLRNYSTSVTKASVT